MALKQKKQHHIDSPTNKLVVDNFVVIVVVMEEGLKNLDFILELEILLDCLAYLVLDFLQLSSSYLQIIVGLLLHLYSAATLPFHQR